MSNSDVRFTVVKFHFLQSTMQYPLESIAIGQHGDEHFQAQISLIDPETSRILAFVHSGFSMNEQEKDAIAKKYCEFLRRSHLSVPVYLFTYSTLTPDVPAISIRTNDNQWESIGSNQFPTLERLIKFNDAQVRIEASKTRASRDNALDDLTYKSHLAFSMLLFLLILPWVGSLHPALVFSYSSSQQYIIAGMIITLLAPYYPIIKAFGVELSQQRTEISGMYQREHQPTVNVDSDKKLIEFKK